MNDYKFGLVSVSFRKYSPRDIIKAAKNAGLECIEWGSDIHAAYDNIANLMEIAELQKEFGIYCCSYGTYFHLGTDNLDELHNYIKAAKILGTNVLRLFCGDKCSEEYSETEKAHFLSECRKAAIIAEENGVIFCMECHNWSYTQTIEGAVELMEAVNSPYFRMYWQPNQFVSEEINLKYSSVIEPYCKHIHIFNWQGENRFSLSEGAEIWSKYLKNLETARTLLLEFMPDDKIESLNTEAKSLFKIASASNS